MTVTNTAQIADVDYLRGLLGPGAARYGPAMEEAGQRELAGSATFPADGDWDRLLELGFRRGPALPGDDLFVEAELPEGWTKSRVEGDPLGTEVRDTRGLVRAVIFYKAAFYDRKAFVRVVEVVDRLAHDLVWGEGPVELPPAWAQLTAEEQEEFFARTTNHLIEFEKIPSLANSERPYAIAELLDPDDDPA